MTNICLFHVKSAFPLLFHDMLSCKLLYSIFHPVHNLYQTEVPPLVDHVLSEGRDIVLSVCIHAWHSTWNMTDAGCLENKSLATKDLGYLHGLCSM